ncbi:hypothetical protein JW979_11320 [bacterium]|nr:hypothetical protein [candidate division CSSED10-310 bacterium]
MAKKSILFGLLFLSGLIFLSSGCTEDKTSIDLSGYWQGTIRNLSTKKAWDFYMYFEQNGDDLLGIYTDYRGSITTRSTNHEKSAISFIIDIYPEFVSFFGTVSSRYYMEGTWSYSGDGNNGQWELQRTEDNFKYDNNDNSENETSDNPFSK